MIQPKAGENMGDTRDGEGLGGTSATTKPDGSEVISGAAASPNNTENAVSRANATNVFELNPRKVYSIIEVDRILPIVRRITQEYVEKVQVLMARFESAKGRHDHKLPQIEREINEAVQSWQSKLEKLGLKTKGLWIADFASGDGYFCWKYPEEKVNFWHQYHDGFGGRVKINREQLINATIEVANKADRLAEEKPLEPNL